MTNNSLDTVGKMGITTAAGWAISMQDVELIIRLGSLIVPMVLSIIVFVRNEKHRKAKKHHEKHHEKID